MLNGISLEGLKVCKCLYFTEGNLKMSKSNYFMNLEFKTTIGHVHAFKVSYTVI